MAYTLNSEPPYTFDKPGPLFIAGLPTLKIKSVAGVNSPAIPSGAADIALPANITNPVTVAFESTGVPTGNTVTLTVTPSNGAATQAVSPVLTGTTDLATASVNVTLPMGHSILSATTSYTVVAALGDLLAPYAQGERVERVTLVAGLDGSSQAILTTVSGKNYTHNGPLPTFGS